MINFRLREGEYRTEEEYLRIKNDYLKGMLVKDLKNKYGMGDSYWKKTRKRLIEETGVVRDRVAHNSGKGKYYYKNKVGRYVVAKSLNKNKTLSYGHYSSEKIAKMIVEELKLVNWDKRKLDEIRLKVKANEGRL